MAIPAGVIADARAQAETMLTDACTVLRPGPPAYDAAGGETTTDTPVATGVPCLLRPVAGDERPLAGGLGAVATWTVWLPAGTDVRAGDRVAATVAGATRTLEVQPPVGASSDELLRTVAATEVP